jgi:hypothetical protein
MGDVVILPTRHLDAPESISDIEPLVMRLETEEPEPCSYVGTTWFFVPYRLTVVPFGTRHANPQCAKQIVMLGARISPAVRPPGNDVDVPMPFRVVVCQPWGEPLVRIVTRRQFARHGSDVARLVAQRDSLNAAVASGEASRRDATECESRMNRSAASNTPH